MPRTLSIVDILPTERTPPPDGDPGPPAVHLPADVSPVHPGGAPGAMGIGSWHGIPESAKPTYNRYHVLWGNGDFKTYEFGKDLNKSEYAANRSNSICSYLRLSYRYTWKQAPITSTTKLPRDIGKSSYVKQKRMGESIAGMPR